MTTWVPEAVESAAGIVVASLVTQSLIQAAGALLPPEWRINVKWPIRVAIVALLIPCLGFNAVTGFAWPRLGVTDLTAIGFCLAPAIFTGPLYLGLIGSRKRWAAAALFCAAILTALTPWQLWSWIWAVN